VNEQILHYEARGEADTARLGEALAAVLPSGAVVALDGPLGAGKTRLVQATAAATGVDRSEVVSPTFVLVHEYLGSRPIIHIDAYRVSGDAEFAALGAEEYFSPANMVFIEWANRVPGCLPEKLLQITIEVAGDSVRRFTIAPRGAEYARAVDQLRQRLEDSGELTE
jgi:tRNA threonylcarbamoyladenosine biosynthesis protein TsaE